jgi:hypothetical protein
MWHAGLCTDNDFERFDQSQDEGPLAFELNLMRLLNIDEELIDLYTWLKINAKCFLGHMGVMRMSGEFSTFLFNTYVNIAYTYLRYDIPEGTPAAFAGDDSSICSLVSTKLEFSKYERQLALRGKPNVSDAPSFCSWRLTPDGVFKDPRLLHIKLEIHDQFGDLDNVADSYFQEHMFGYSLGDLVHDHMDEEQLASHSSNCRRFAQMRHRLPSYEKLMSLFRVSTTGS